MRKLLGGFLAGVTVTALWFVSLDRIRNGNTQPVVGRQSVTVLPEMTATTDSVVLIEEHDSSDETQTPVISVPDESSSLEQLQERQMETGRAYFAAVEAFRKALAIAEWSNAPPPDRPILLPPEFDHLSQSPDIWHELIQREPIDPAWSAATELQISTYLANRPEITGRYGFPIINCRATRCEAAFLSYGLEDQSRAAAQQGLTPEFLIALNFRNQNAEVYEQAWAEQFGYVPNRDESDPRILNVQVNSQNDVTTILWHFTVEDAQRQARP